MPYKRIDELVGDEVLGREILTSDYQTLLPKGAVLKREYIERLQDLGVFAVYIKEDIPVTNEIAILKTDVEQEVKTKIKGILEHHTYQNNHDLEELSVTADNIISNIILEEEVMEQVYDIRERNADIYEHSLSVCSLAIILGLRLGLLKERIHDLGVGCLLHDIGLRYLTIDYSNQDISMLSEEDRKEFMKHPVFGYSSLKNERWISNTSKDILLYHHERKDGSGYPLRTKTVPSIEVSIAIICDIFDELICGIGFEKKKVHEAIEYIKAGRESKFNAKIVEELLELVAVYPAGTKVLTTDGELAIVIRQNKGLPDRPVLRIVRDKQGNNVTTDKIKDLAEIESLYIEKLVEN